jgi:hypothetical protein
MKEPSSRVELRMFRFLASMWFALAALACSPAATKVIEEASIKVE